MTMVNIPPRSSFAVECLHCVIPTLASEASGLNIGSDAMLWLPPFGGLTW